MSYHENSRKTFVAGAVIASQSVVKLGTSGVEPCGSDDLPLGFVEIGARAIGEQVSVRLINTPGTVEVRAGGSITAGSLVSPGTDGTVVAQSDSAQSVGIALAAAANGELVEIVPVFDSSAAAAAAAASINDN